MNKKFAFNKVNYILIAIGVIIIILGFVLMTGPSTTETTFEPSIFSARRIKVAPLVCLLGFLFMIPAIMYRPKGKKQEEQEKTEE